ncbi:hypothetical protein JRO89_XS10G0097700 [Xanthoceras sorbifolium]|uniref:Uncharacterized protein n=1 Tax=Xanthoceras sorbifolium TaxID=99658 RepID=A0ABQ8HID7_9ROSI|nr:hypothetical protein JRO89_XS10G0097700 [Xanthoceras sorbifolium]
MLHSLHKEMCLGDLEEEGRIRGNPLRHGFWDGGRRTYEARNANKLRANLDLLEEKHEQAMNTKKRGSEVLGPNWEGLYPVKHRPRPGAYKLAYLDSRVVEHAWNAD